MTLIVLELISMKKVYGYIRVSTVKQGTGVSLQEQKEAIIRYAEKHQLNIIEWFEEKETAAKQGRPLFNQMMKLLKDRKANGVVFHKIDRGSRNYKDWASIDELIASGIELHFAHESLDMNTRAGRLTADMLQALATDYIRNLREEATKGLYGRLKQGIYPFSAPIGYVNTGKGNAKAIDPIQGPLVRKAFELYATRNYSHPTLTETMKNLGLRNTAGNVVQENRISTMLNNPFYTGVMKVKGKAFQGKHKPLVSSQLFVEVQNIMKGKVNTRVIKHDFIFRRRIKCINCGYNLIGEMQKGHNYYRCQTRNCPTKTIREELLELMYIEKLKKICLNSSEKNFMTQLLEQAQLNWSETQQGLEQSLSLQKNKLNFKMNRLTDAYLEDVLDKNQFELKKEELMIELQGIQSQESNLSNQKEAIFKKAKNFLELLNNLKKTYTIGLPEEKRKIIESVTSNLSIQRKNVMLTMLSPFNELANRNDFIKCALERGIPRTKIANTATSAVHDNHTSIKEESLKEIENNPKFRESMKGLLDLILTYCEKKVEDDEEDNADEIL